MTIKEYVTDVIQKMDEVELREVADYLAYLRFRSRAHVLPQPNDSVLIAYRKFGEEDRIMAEEGMASYQAGLRVEDAT